MSRRLHRRASLLFAASLLLLLILFARAFQLQVLRGESFASQAKGQQENVIDVPGLRGAILDRNGLVLADSEPSMSIFADPVQVTNPVEEADRIAKVLGQDREPILKSLTAPGRFSYVAKKVDLKRAEKIKNMDLAGIDRHPDTVRVRPQGDIASQVIGAVRDDDGVGVEGIEASEESALHGTDGKRRLVTDAKGDPLKLENVSDAQDGETVKLTLDTTIQAKAEKALAEMAAVHHPVDASAIVMDARNSEVLAMANWPPVDASGGSYSNNGASLPFEPGSTFKSFTVAAALQTKTVTPESTFTLAPTIQVADRTIEESHERGTVDLSVGDILAQSSNVGAVTIGLRLGGRRLSRWIDRFGFGRPTGIDLSYEEPGLVPPYKDWSGSSIGNLPIGQGLAVTPIQMVQAYGALANGGILRQPALVKSVDGKAVPVDQGERILSPQVAAEVRQMLKGVLAAGGTASEVEVPGYTLAGKTGTAQIATKDGYSDTRYVASFVGIAPADEPAIVVAVKVSEPQNGHSGGEVAAPVVGEITASALPYLGIPTD